MTIEKRKETPEVEQNINKDNHHLILNNDDVHTFDYVIDALIEIIRANCDIALFLFLKND